MNEKAERLGILDSRVVQLSESLDTKMREIDDITARLSQKGEKSKSLTSNIQEGEKSMLDIEKDISTSSLIFKEACLSAEKSAKAAKEAQIKAVHYQKWSETCQVELEKARKKKEKMNSSLDVQKETRGRLEDEKKLDEENLISARQKIHELQEELQLTKMELKSLLHGLLNSLEVRKPRGYSFSSVGSACPSVTDDANSGMSDGSSSSSTDDTQMSPSLPKVQKLTGGWVTGVSATVAPGVRWYNHSKKCPEGTWKCPEMIKEDLKKGSLGSNTLGGGVSSSNSLTGAVLTSSSSSSVTGSLAAEEASSSSSDTCVPPAIKTSSGTVSSSSESGSPALWVSSSSRFSVSVLAQGGLNTSKTGGSPLGTNPSSRKRPRDEEEEVDGEEEVSREGFSRTRGPVRRPSPTLAGTVFPGGGLATNSKGVRKPVKKKVKKSQGNSGGTSVLQFLSDDEEDNCEVPEEDDPKDPDYHDSGVSSDSDDNDDDNDDFYDSDASDDES